MTVNSESRVIDFKVGLTNQLRSLGQDKLKNPNIIRIFGILSVKILG